MKSINPFRTVLKRTFVQNNFPEHVKRFVLLTFRTCENFSVELKVKNYTFFFFTYKELIM